MSSTNKKFRIQNGVDVADGGISINDVTVIGADGKVVPAAIADAVAGLTSSDIADLQAQVSAILGTSPETLDTLQEIVTAFENADSTLTQAVADNTAAHQANTTAISDEETARIAGDATVQAAVDATNARTAGISTSSGSSNIQMAAEVDMDGNAVTNMADPSSAQDAATKAYVDAASGGSSSDATTKADAAEAAAKAHADAGDANLQGQIDLIVGSSPASLDTLQEIVTAFENADSTLTGAVASNSTAISNETSARQNAVQSLQDQIDQEQMARQAGDASLQNQIDQVGATSSTDLSDLEEKIFGDGSLEFPTSQLGGGTPFLWDMVNDNTSAIGGLMSSKADKTTVASDIATAKSEAISAAATDATTKADAAEADAKAYTDAAEVRVENSVNVETARAVAVEGSLQAQIDSASSTGVNGRQALQDAIDAEVLARIAGDAANSAEVSAEADARQQGDATLQSNIDTVSAAVEAITNGSPEQLNQLTELVAAYESADADLTALIANLGSNAGSLESRFNADSDKMAAIQPVVSGNTSDIAQEVLDRIAGDEANSAEVAAEASARAAAVSAETTARQNAITAETNARILADNGLQAQIDALDTSTSGDKSDLQAQITSNDNDIAALQSRAGTIEADYATQASLNAEIARATAAEGVNATAISNEETRATAAEAVIAGDLAQEIIDRQNADAALQSQIDFIESNTDAAALDSLTEIVAAFQGADSNILGVVTSNTGRISALENNVGIIQAWNTDNVAEGQVNLYFTEARAKACVGADAGSCIDYDQAAGKFSLDLTETAGALVPDNSSNADKLDGQHGSHYRIDVYDVNGTVVN